MTQAQRAGIGFTEFVMLMALAMSLVALAIDSILPAFPLIGENFGIERSNDLQYLIAALFGGLSIGQLVAGPLSDTIGRKRALYIGLIIFILGSLIAYAAPSFEIMLIGRFIQGLGAAAPRIVTIAMVRDRYVGRDMARVMSYIMGVFILVPILAPSVGLAVIKVADWHAIFLGYAVITMIIFVWSALRLDETLSAENKRAFTMNVIFNGVKQVCTNRMCMCYTIASGFIFGGLMGYVNSSQQIYQEYYDTGDMFAIYFGIGAASLGVAFFANAAIVRRLGMRWVIIRSMLGVLVFSSLFIAYEMINGGVVPLPLFVGFMMIISFCLGMCFGNLNALAMVPMGHLAGIASAVIGAASLVVALIVGNSIGQLFSDNLYPLSVGFVITAVASLLLIKFAEKATEQVLDT